jgi:RecA/RadA recombinase
VWLDDNKLKLYLIVYLSCGEGPFPIKRLQQIASCVVEKRCEYASDVDEKRLLMGVHIEDVYSIEDMQAVLDDKVPHLCVNHRIRLLVLDSIAGLFRREFDESTPQQMQQRTNALFRLSASLKRLASFFNIGVVVINQGS